MKKLLTLILLLMVSVEMYAQSNITTFLGIPVDGTESSMIQKLQKKGFVYNKEEDLLEGEFNGEDVFIGRETQKGKVWAVGVGYNSYFNAASLKINYEKLCRQFRDNPKYIVFSEDTLPDSKDLNYEVSVNKQSYNAIYIQNPQFNESDWNRRVVVSFGPIETENHPIGYYMLTIGYINGFNQANGEDL